MRTSILIAGLLIGASWAHAADPVPPTVPVETLTLDNGLTILLSHDARLPVVAVELRYLVGSGHEPKGRSGFAHLFEHLMFQGSKNYDQDYFGPFEPIGGSVNGTTNTDRTNFYERVPSQYLDMALWMESDRLEFLLDALTQKKLDNQRDVVKNERRQRYENTPYGEVWISFAHNLYPEGHPYHHTTIGSHEDLTAANLDDVKGFFRQYYVPKNLVLTVTGDFDREWLVERIKHYFGHLPPGERAPMPKAEMPKLTKIVHVTDTDNVKLPRVHLAWHTPGFLQDGDSAMDALAGILTGGKTSRLYKPLVYDQKVAKDVVAFQASRALGSYFVIWATAAPGKTTDEVYAALQKAVETALATPPTQDELDRTINGWRKSFYGRTESVLARAQLLSTYFHLKGKADYLAEDLARYTSLTPDSVHAQVKEWLHMDNFVRVDIVPEPPKVESPKKVDAPKGGAK